MCSNELKLCQESGSVLTRFHARSMDEYPQKLTENNRLAIPNGGYFSSYWLIRRGRRAVENTDRPTHGTHPPSNDASNHPNKPPDSSADFADLSAKIED